MPNRPSVEYDAGTLMVIDKGARNLEHSIWNASYGGTQFNAPKDNGGPEPLRTPTDPAGKAAYDKLVSIVPIDLLRQVWMVFADFASTQKRARAAHTPAPAIPQIDALTKKIQQTVEETVTRAVQETVARELRNHTATTSNPGRQQQPKTWASLLYTGDTRHHNTETLAKPVPARHEREIIITAPNMPEEYTQRSPKDTVQAINTTLRTEAAVAARRLPSGDYAITFANPAKIHAQDPTWVKSVFGEEAKVAPRVYTVVAKGIRTEAALGNREDLIKEIESVNKVEVLRTKAIRPRNENATKTTLIVGVSSVADANKLCDFGLVINAEIANCEPYEESVRPRQCYNCYQYGHIARQCKSLARCGRCSAAAHTDGESTCPAAKGETPAKCLLCKQDHPAWARTCPVAEKQWERARDDYTRRPQRFVDGRRQTTPLPSQAPTPAEAAITSLKRRTRGPGRPKGSKAAAVESSEGIRRFTRQRSPSEPTPTLSQSSFPFTQSQCN